MKSNLDKYYKTDKALEEEGQWFWITPDEIGFRCRPFQQTNPRVKAAMAVHYKPHARQIDLGTISVEKNLEIQVKLFLDISLVDWLGVEIDGKVTPYKDMVKEQIVKFLVDRPALFKELWDHANDHKNYIEDLGNY